MGIVFQALDTQLNRQVALKIITPHIGEDENFRARFTREAQAQASLDSPHVVQVYSFGEADGRLYIASQLIPDGDLGQMLNRHGRPPARIAVNLISQIADGLADAHAAGLIHRDIKPANVLLRNRDSSLHAYLGDFGIARHVSAETQLTHAGGTVGTPSYMAPELHMGGDAGPASDIYSLGCLLWASLSGSAPYAGSTDYQVVMAHLERPIPQLAESGPLAAEINRVLRSAMAKQPTDRYPSVAAMRDDLKQVVRMPDDPTPIRLQGEATPSPTPTQPSWQFSPSRTPTPTPTPVPTSNAPAAPPFRTPTPQPPHFSGPTGPAPRPSSPRGSARIWIVVAVLAVVLGTGAALTVALVAGGDDNPGSSDNGGGGGGEGNASDEEKAVESLTAGLVDDPNSASDEETSRCLAEKLVETQGVDKLIDLGILADDLSFQSEADDPAIAGPIFEAGLACIQDQLGSITSTPSS